MGGYNMGGLVSTVNDCARFIGMMACGGRLGNVRILKEATVKRYCYKNLFPEALHKGKYQRTNNTPYGWTAIGEIGVPKTARDTLPDEADSFEVGEVGGGGAACTYWSINPDRDLAVAWFTQSVDNDPYVKAEENIFAAARKVCPRKSVKATTTSASKRNVKKTVKNK